MSENKAIKINEKIEIPKLRLWLIWLLLFVFPSIASILCFNYLSKEYKYFVNTDLIYEGFEKIKKYNDLIVPENYIENQQSIIQNLNTNISPEKLKEQIDSIILGETSYCIFFDEDFNNAKIVKKTDAKNLSLPLLKRYFKTLVKDYYLKEQNPSKESDYNSSQTQLANFLQTLFNTATSISISINQTSKNFSVLQEGEIYFIFTKFNNSNKECSWCFAVLKGKDFSYTKMIKNLQNEFPEIKIVLREFPLNKTVTPFKPPLSYCGIKSNKDELYIIATTDLKFTRHFVFNGTHELDKRYDNLFPFIKYNISLEKTEKNIKEISKKINFFALFIILISAIYSLYISLFNFNKNLKFKTKILLLTLLSSLFPFSLFSFGIYAYEHYNRFITETSIKQQAEFELNFVAKELEHYLMEIESRLSEIAKSLSDDLINPDLKPSSLLDRLNDIANEIPISKESLYLNPVPNNLKIITTGNQINKSFDERLSKEFFEEMTNGDIDNLPATILPYLKEDYPSDREEKDYFEIAGQKVVSYDIGKSLVNSGKFIKFDQPNGASWINSQQLRNNETNEVIGLFMTKYEPRPILSFFFSKRCNQVRKNFKEVKEKDNYEINYAFLPIGKSGTASIWNGSGIISSEDRNRCLKNFQKNELHFSNKTIIVKENQNVPFLSVAIIKELQPYDETKFILNVLIAIILYLSLILLFTSNLLDIIFVEPVMQMALNAKNIAKGGEEWYSEIKSGDEFEELNNNFKNLVTGLKERNILKSYVSEDAFSDIEESESLKLLPGGEYMEATIVFSALKGYEKLSKEISPQESIELLSKFMSIAEEVTKKYNGSIDKIIGDTIMLVFRNNPNLPSHALRAAKSSLELVEKAKIANLPDLYTGIASGKVISGKIGSYTGKLDFTVIGNPVNSAARFKAESKKGSEQTGIIISGTTIGLTKGKAKVKFLRRVAIKGKSRKYNIYELVGIRD